MHEYLSDLSSDDDIDEYINSITKNKSQRHNRNILKNYQQPNNRYYISQEDFDLSEAIRQSLLDRQVYLSGVNSSNFSQNMQNNANIDPPQREMTFEDIIEQSKREERETENIRKFISNKELLTNVLKELNGVNPDDECFNEFYE